MTYRINAGPMISCDGRPSATGERPLSSRAVATVEDLLSCIDDPDGDSTRALVLVREIGDSNDTTLMPRLQAELEHFVDQGHFYGRDIIAQAMAELAGVDALPALITASARDIGDDQDTLQAVILDLITIDPGRARSLLQQMAPAPAALRETLSWALEFAQARRPGA